MNVNDSYHWVLILSIEIPTYYKDNVSVKNLKANFDNAMGNNGSITLVKNAYGAHNANVFADTGSIDTFYIDNKKAANAAFSIKLKFKVT